ncbi:MAG: PTS sugar transporter subunit IIA [Candidatus Cloacimonetes bacterium]|nr:PTS sugar transporter subunit IIA [Candidatus Cloacimonadota bacterium]
MEKILIISDLINQDFIIDIKSNNKEDALNELLDVMCTNQKITDPKIFRKEICKRENS